jgi:hypothetical protein
MTALGPMTVPRAVQTATKLADGRVFFIGGFGTDSRSDPASTEFFDPSNNRFDAGPRLATPRFGHTATRLEDGRVLVAGGFGPDGKVLDSAEIFDPKSGAFAATGRLATARGDHEAVLLDDGRVVVIGGTADDVAILASAEVFDPRTGTFSATGAMTAAREGITATKLLDGRILVAGGHIGRHEQRVILASADLYDPATGRFTGTAAMTIPRHKHDAVLLADGRVLLIGGSDARDDQGLYDAVEVFDPRTGTFTAVGRLHHPRYKLRFASVLLPDGRVLVAGGAATPELFDPRTNVFVDVDASLGRAPYFGTATLLDDGSVLVAGGYSDRGYASDAAWLIRP